MYGDWGGDDCLGAGGHDRAGTEDSRDVGGGDDRYIEDVGWSVVKLSNQVIERHSF